jgi:hypothetical protein
MTAALATLSRTARLLSLLRVPRRSCDLYERATDETLAEARTLGPELAAETISSVLDAYVAYGDPKIAERAADVARELRLTSAVAALVRCVDRLPADDVVNHVSLRALERMKVEATGPLLEMFRRCTTAEERRLNAPALVAATVRDGRTRVVLCSMLEESPTEAACCLREHGDRDAVPALAAALDRLELPPLDAPDELERCEALVALVQALRPLGARLSRAQQAKFKAAWERSGVLLGVCGPEIDLPLTP